MMRIRELVQELRYLPCTHPSLIPGMAYGPVAFPGVILSTEQGVSPPHYSVWVPHNKISPLEVER